MREKPCSMGFPLVYRGEIVYNEIKYTADLPLKEGTVMSYQEKATELHESGCNCCQAVLGACCEKWKLDPDTAYRLGAFFGAGMRRGEVCGAATGALMALGMEYG